MTDYTTDYRTLPLEIDVTIRPAEADDLSHLEWGGRYWKYRNIFRRAYNDQLRGRRLMLLADVNGYPIGQIFIQLKAGNTHYADGHTRSYLYSLRVMPHMRGMGIGTALIDAAEGEILERGFTMATIAVSKENQRALRLYQRLGYAVFGTDPGRWNFIDPDGRVHYIEEPCWGLEKHLVE